MIEIINRQKKHPVRTRAFKSLLKGLAARHRLIDPEVTLAFVGTAAIRTLNRKFMKKDEPTDVLSFPLRKKGPDGRFYLGDIVIAVPFAARQAREKGRGVDRELELLAVHGFLHLLGYDHSARMDKEEERAGRGPVCGS
jgi:probable rRNA maturation factor